MASEIEIIARYCAWCGEPLPARSRSDRRYCDSSCRAEATYDRQNRSGTGGKALKGAESSARRPAPTLSGSEKQRWVAVAEQGILDWFRANPSEPFHADHLDGLLPTSRRRAISDAVRNSVNKGWIVRCGVRASKIPSRNSAKSGEYRLTEKGVAEVRRMAAPPPRPEPAQIASTSPYSPENPYA